VASESVSIAEAALTSTALVLVVNDSVVVVELATRTATLPPAPPAPPAPTPGATMRRQWWETPLVVNPLRHLAPRRGTNQTH